MNTKSYLSTLSIKTRTKDVITDSEDLERLYSFACFPVQLGCTSAPFLDDKYADMDFLISRSSGCIQLGSLIEPSILYESSHAAGTVGGIWEQHHKEFAEFVSDFKPKDVIEIGGGHGQLFKIFEENQNLSSWTIIEPNPLAAPSPKLRIIRKFFNNDFSTDQKYDVAVHSHTLEHMYSPAKFLEAINTKLLKNDGYLCFSVPDIEYWLSKKYTNAINFEHTFLINDKYTQLLLATSGFEIVASKKFGNGHSTFYAAKKTLDPFINNLSSFDAFYERNYSMAMDYRSYLLNEVSQINAAINQCSNAIYIFGAHVFTQTLISLGLETKKITSILDNSTQKHGLRLYGTNLMVNNPICLNEIINPAVIIRAGIYDSEIKDGLLKINKNINFI